ncbi:DUF3050 domain-containing protein [Brevibacillus daliensis]|uniref:DUF3050 domain-containing protein n=1 Tax=Brevibacillus daliensis TaxID=2892995 RepID=UPI001E318858|nr:DUF3050 domain-containing protein [Brevibacillus daliensis]
MSSQASFERVAAIREQLLKHPVSTAMQTPESVKIFMEHHVFAVWDFMSLLKRLQIDITYVRVPWVPVSHASYARFVNEIVLGEETDEDGEGGFISHFELYLQAMKEVGADTTRIERFIDAISNGVSVDDALLSCEAPPSVERFVKHTMYLAEYGQTHQVCAAFFFGREDIIPDMFQVLVDELTSKGETSSRLVYYLQRHIELDGDEHGPLAEKLLSSLCGEDSVKHEEAGETAAMSLQMRIGLWDGVLEEMRLRQLS